MTNSPSARYRAVINPRAVGLGITALVRMDCENKISCVRRELDLGDFPEVRELHRVSGDACSVLVVNTRDVAHLEELLDRLSRWSRASTSLILSSPVEHAPIPRTAVTGPDDPSAAQPKRMTTSSRTTPRPR